jgi:hypothetical protein
MLTASDNCPRCSTDPFEKLHNYDKGYIREEWAKSIP